MRTIPLRIITLMAVTATLLSLSACGGKSSLIQGDWLLVENNAPTRQGIRLGSQGIAASIHQTHKQYTAWERHGSTLILRGKIFGEFDIVDFSDTVKIARLSQDELWTTHDSDLVKYRRRSREK